MRIYTDSQYLRLGITVWSPKWKANGWRTYDRKPVKNVDLWRRLDAAAAPHKIDWRWVRGHAGNAGNERADALAASAVPSMPLSEAAGERIDRWLDSRALTRLRERGLLDLLDA